MPPVRVLAAALLLLLGPAPAAALAQTASVSVGGSPAALTYSGVQGTDRIFVQALNGGMNWVLDRDGAAAALMSAGAGCTDVFANGTRIACPITGNAAIDLKGGDDFVSGGADGHGMSYDAGDGDDTVIPGGNAQHLVDLGDGADTLNGSGAPNSDVVDGGPGDDLLRFLRGPDDYAGGAGVDTVELTSSGAPVSVTLDGVVDDGASDDFDARVRADVENLLGGDQDDTFTGSAVANVLEGRGGQDVLGGGAGHDVLAGGPGNDQIEARDGEADTVDCGVGVDVATVDPADTVTGCETVSLPDEDEDGVTAPQDCDDGDAAIRPGATDRPGDGIDQDCSGADASAPPPPPPVRSDRDGDGSLAPGDCDDADPARFPGAVDVPADGIDQDCSGADAALAEMAATVQNRWLVGRRKSRVVALKVRNAPAGATVVVRCKGRSCPFARKTLAAPAGKAGLTRLFPRALRVGARVTVVISAPGYVDKKVRYTIRRSRIPAVKLG